VQSMTRVLANPPEIFTKEIHGHFTVHAKTLFERYLPGSFRHHFFFRMPFAHGYNPAEIFHKAIQSFTGIWKERPGLISSHNDIFCSCGRPAHCFFLHFDCRLELWSSVSQSAMVGSSTTTGLPAGLTPPDFPLMPASRGFCLTLARALEAFKAALATAALPPTNENSSL
jgi:hypothetical protein